MFESIGQGEVERAAMLEPGALGFKGICVRRIFGFEGQLGGDLIRKAAKKGGGAVEPLTNVDLARPVDPPK